VKRDQRAGLFDFFFLPLRWLALALVLTTFVPVLSAFELPERIHKTLSDNWLFQFTQKPAEALSANAWQPITIPHTWNADDGMQIQRMYRRGVGTYQRSITIPAAWRGCSIFVTVGAANATASITINGTVIAEHTTGFTAFTADLTPHVQYDGDNVVVVTVDNRPSLEYPPLISDYTFFGGLYRNVWLTVTEPVHVSLLHHSSPGIYLEQTSVTKNQAEVQTHIEIANDHPYGIAEVRAQVEVLTQEGAVVIVAKSDAIKMAPKSGQRITIPITIQNPRLWNGRQDPFMYRARICIFHGERCTDVLEPPLGLRYFTVDPNRGFILNGQPYDLYGVALHQDRADKGWAINDVDRQEDVALATEVGAHIVRLVHYPHAPATLNLLNKAGLIAWSEIPIAYRLGKMPAFQDNTRAMLTERILQLYNHPSICFWGLFNELAGNRDEPLALIQDLHNLAKVLDPQRLTTGAAGAIDADRICAVPDVIAFNRYFGWFIPGANLLGPWAASGHQLFPERGMGLAEYGAEGDLAIHADHRSPKEKNIFGMDPRRGAEEFQSQLHEELWPQIADKKYLEPVPFPKIRKRSSRDVSFR